MNRREANTALLKALAYCPSQSMTDLTPDAWAEALDDIRLADALEAIRIIGRRELEPGKSRYIEPGHIRAEVRRIRQARLDNAPTYEPPPGLNTREHIEWLREARQAIADGDVPRHAGNHLELITRPLDLPELKGMDD